ncbi:MAG: amino acid-binding protein [Archaeoglobus sp.]|jgi:ACT domain-containing protein|nr:MAG: amino acid-binding protein [Archaeoglobus sp.]
MAVVTLVVELKDKPGQLAKVIEPVSKYRGNIISIVHKREKRTPTGSIPVEISIEIDEKSIGKLVENIRSQGVVVKSYNEVRLTSTTSVMLIGHIIHTDLATTIDAVDRTGFAEVVEMHISMPYLEKPSTAMMTISATGEKKLKVALDRLKEVCMKKKITVIEPLELEE